MMDIKVGDNVFIKNFETQKLTVEHLDQKTATCIYLDWNNEFKRIFLQLVMLVKVSYNTVAAISQAKRIK